jgi:hypothetical protein
MINEEYWWTDKKERIENEEVNPDNLDKLKKDFEYQKSLYFRYEIRYYADKRSKFFILALKSLVNISIILFKIIKIYQLEETIVSDKKFIKDFDRLISEFLGIKTRNYNKDYLLDIVYWSNRINLGLDKKISGNNLIRFEIVSKDGMVEIMDRLKEEQELKKINKINPRYSEEDWNE